VRFENLLDVTVAVARLGTKSITYAFEFLKDGEAVARGQVTCVCCVVGEGQPMRGREIPASFRALLEAAKE
jgi:acyl-CoA thioesterase FadM